MRVTASQLRERFNGLFDNAIRRADDPARFMRSGSELEAQLGELRGVVGDIIIMLEDLERAGVVVRRDQSGKIIGEA